MQPRSSFIAAEDISAWDDFVASHPFGWMCHLSQWREVIERSFGHIRGHFIALRDEDDRIVAGVPLYQVSSWLTGRRLISVPFGTLCDPLIADGDEMKALMPLIIQLCDQSKSSFVELRTLHAWPMIEDERLLCKRYYQHHYLALDREPELLKKSFDRSCIRQRIDRSLKSGISFLQGTDDYDVKRFYELYVITRQRVGLPPQPYRFIKTLWDVFHQQKMVDLLLAAKDQKIIAGMILFKYKDRVSAEFAVSDKNYQAISPNHFLFWNAISLSYSEGYKIFDFGQTSPSNTSLMDFKRRWGTTVVDLPYFYYSKKKLAPDMDDQKEESLAYRVVRRFCRSAPQKAVRLLGNICYRHLG